MKDSLVWPGQPPGVENFPTQPFSGQPSANYGATDRSPGGVFYQYWKLKTLVYCSEC